MYCLVPRCRRASPTLASAAARVCGRRCWRRGIVSGCKTALGFRRGRGKEVRMGKRLAIVGAGAVGGYVGAHMVAAGEDVTFIDPWPAHVEHMRQHGLRVTHARDVAEFSVPVRVLHVTDVQQLSKEAPVDIAFVCMKSYDTAWATMMIKQYLSPD